MREFGQETHQLDMSPVGGSEFSLENEVIKSKWRIVWENSAPTLRPLPDHAVGSQPGISPANCKHSSSPPLASATQSLPAWPQPPAGLSTGRP